MQHRAPTPGKSSAEHSIVSGIEIIPMDQVDEAYKRILKSDVRYRFVIDMAPLR